METKNTSKTHPVTYNLRNSERNIVDLIAVSKGKDGKAASKSAIVRDAIRLYALVNEKLNQGQKLRFIDGDGMLTPIEEIWFKDLEIPIVQTAVVETKETKEGEITDVDAVLQACINLNQDPNFQITVGFLGLNNLIGMGKTIIEQGKAFFIKK